MTKVKSRESRVKSPESRLKTKDQRPQTKESDWNDIERRVRSLSRFGDEGIRIPRSPEETLAEAQRLAEYYRKAGKPLPDTLAALV